MRLTTVRPTTVRPTTVRPRTLRVIALRLAGVLAVALLAAGCQVATTVGVRVGPTGSGTVTVRIHLDAQAAAQVGSLRSVLDPAGLAAAGWMVRLPSPSVAAAATRTGETATAVHHFTDLAQLPGVLAEVGAAGGDGHPLFVLRIARHPGFLATTEQLRGTVDLSCGLGCFGDAALRRRFGSVVGVDAGALRRSYHETPAQALRFRLSVVLPAPLVRSNADQAATGRAAGGRTRLTWTAPLGRTTEVMAATRQVDRGHVRLLEAACAAAGVVVLAAIALWWRRRRRRRRRRGDGIPEPVTARP